MHYADSMEAKIQCSSTNQETTQPAAAAADWEPLDFLAPLDTSRGPREVQHTQFARSMATKVVVATMWLLVGIVAGVQDSRHLEGLLPRRP